MDGNNGNTQLNEQTKPEAQQQASEAPNKGKDRKSKALKEIREWVVALVVAVLIVMVIQSFLFRIIRVDGHSMDSTLADGERLFVTVADYKLGDIDRGDVVICHYPDRYTTFLGFIRTKTFFVKRCVAVPGDTVYRANNITHVVYEKDGETVDEALDDFITDGAYPISIGEDYKHVLGEDEYFVVGDNRYNSHDSRDWKDADSSRDVGPISSSMIVGHVREVIWPLGKIRSVK